MNPSESWIVTVPPGGLWKQALGSPVISIHTASIVGGGPLALVRVVKVEVENRNLSRHPWINKDVDEISGFSHGVNGNLSITFGNSALRPISFLLTATRVLLGRDGEPWPD